MRKLILTRVTLFALLLGAVGCNEGFEPEAGLSPLTENQTNIADSRDQVHYNKTCASQIEGYFENWYKLEHMRQAYSNIVGSTRAESDDIITATHYHYKFIPKDGAELTLLEDCPDLELFAYPLDAIVSEGEYFESENPLLRYAVVPVDKVLPDVEKELLYEMFIPDDSRTRMPTRCSHIDPEMADRLVAEAMRITGNEEEPVNKTRASKWYGRGCIIAYDDVVDAYIPLRGVKVRITRAGVTHTAITDSLGEFRMTDGFIYGAKYSIIWERADWDIRDGATGQAFYQTDSNVTNQSWYLNIKAGKSQNYAAIHRAVYRHCYGENLDFFRYNTSPRLQRAIKISHMDNSHEEGWGGYFTSAGSAAISDIVIFRYNRNGLAFTVPQIIKTTHHELGHAVHCYHMYSDSEFNFNTDTTITESWAEFISYMLAMKEYEDWDRLEYYTYGCEFIAKEIIHNKYDFKWSKQYTWPFTYGDEEGAGEEYSPLFIDLLDSNNQYIIYDEEYDEELYSEGSPNDNITGYTVDVLCFILLQSYSFDSMKSALKSYLPVGVTSENIDLLFETYEKHWVY